MIYNLHNISKAIWLVHYFKILTLLLKIDVILLLFCYSSINIHLLLFFKVLKNKLLQQISCHQVSF